MARPDAGLEVCSNTEVHAARHLRFNRQVLFIEERHRLSLASTHLSLRRQAPHVTHAVSRYSKTGRLGRETSEHGLLEVCDPPERTVIAIYRCTLGVTARRSTRFLNTTLRWSAMQAYDIDTKSSLALFSVSAVEARPKTGSI